MPAIHKRSRDSELNVTTEPKKQAEFRANHSKTFAVEFANMLLS